MSVYARSTRTAPTQTTLTLTLSRAYDNTHPRSDTEATRGLGIVIRASVVIHGSIVNPGIIKGVTMTPEPRDRSSASVAMDCTRGLE